MSRGDDRRASASGFRRGEGGAAPPFISLATGTFARNLAALARNGAWTPGTVLDTYAIDAPAYEMIDGLRLLRIEGERTNNARSSRNRAGAGWSAGSLVTETSGQAGPDGVASAYREEVQSLGFSRYIVPLATSNPCVFSCYQKAGAGSDGSYQMRTRGTAFVYHEATSGLATAWERGVMRVTDAAAVIAIPCDGRAGTITFAGARDTITDLPQIEAGRFPSSPIIVPGNTAVTRPADTLTWAAAPAGLLTDVHGFRHVRPQFTSSTDIDDGASLCLISLAGGGGLGGVFVRQAAGILTVDLVDNAGVTRAQSQPLATLADDDLGSVVWDLAGRVYIDGTPGPVGAACTWSAGAYRVGGIHGGAGEAFCAFSDIY